MSSNAKIKTAFTIYGLAWKLLMPVLRLNKRIADGFDRRALRRGNFEKSELWIQAASAGEAYIAAELLKRLKFRHPAGILMTTNTIQGMEILQHAARDAAVSARAEYFPFDKPGIMEAAVGKIQPKTMVLLEAELWPGHLQALKKSGCKILVINGRMKQKSFEKYMLWPGLWRSLKPDRILTISQDDAARFGQLFDKHAEVMPNIKFDRLENRTTSGKLSGIPKEVPFIVFGSTLEPEEELVEKMILHVAAKKPEAVIGLFPRHMHRIAHWESALNRIGISWKRRSETDAPASPGTIVLWDVFGELCAAYESATAAFVGGSLLPLGGQNFLEAAMSGVKPVIGPHWKDFAWVGSEFADFGLVHVAAGWPDAAEHLVRNADSQTPREEMRKAALAYMNDRRGGAALACRLIENSLEPHA